jgi:gliding motility-associated-like protein
MYEICDDGFPVKCDTAMVIINIFVDKDCDGIPDEPEKIFLIPEGFSPNGDGIHDYFEVLGLEDFPEATIYIFNRWGNKLFEKKNYGNLTVWGSKADAWWDGYSDSKWMGSKRMVTAGNYMYILKDGKGKTYTGTVMVSY